MFLLTNCKIFPDMENNILKRETLKNYIKNYNRIELETFFQKQLFYGKIQYIEMFLQITNKNIINSSTILNYFKICILKNNYELAWYIVSYLNYIFIEVLFDTSNYKLNLPDTFLLFLDQIDKNIHSDIYKYLYKCFIQNFLEHYKMKSCNINKFFNCLKTRSKLLMYTYEINSKFFEQTYLDYINYICEYRHTNHLITLLNNKKIIDNNKKNYSNLNFIIINNIIEKILEYKSLYRNTNELIYIFKHIIKKYKYVTENNTEIIKNNISLNINLNTIASIKGGHLLFKLLNKYIAADLYTKYDWAYFYPIKDAAKYGCFKTFLYLFKKTNYNSTTLEGLMEVSIENKDNRIFKYICDHPSLFPINNSIYIYIINHLLELKEKNKEMNNKEKNKDKNNKQKNNFNYFIKKYPLNNELLNMIILKLDNKLILKKLLSSYLNFDIEFKTIVDNIKKSTQRYCESVSLIIIDNEIIDLFFQKTNFKTNKFNLEFILYVYFSSDNISKNKNIQYCLDTDISKNYNNYFLVFIKYNTLHYSRLLSETLIDKLTIFKTKIDYDTLDTNSILILFNNYYFKSWCLFRHTNIFKILFVNGINIHYIFKHYKFNSQKLNDNEIHLYNIIKVIHTFKKYIQKKKGLKKSIHLINFSDTLSIVNKEHFSFSFSNIFKIKNNPVHINPNNFLDNFSNTCHYISPKADGVYEKINMNEYFPQINCINIYDLESENTIINNCNINLIFTTFEEIRHLRFIHPYIDNQFDTNYLNSDFALNDSFANFLEHEKIQLEKFVNENKHKYTKLWWPKIVFKYDPKVINFNSLKEKYIDIFPSDGWILFSGRESSKILKLKPDEHLTIDLLYNNVFTYDNNIRFNFIENNNNFNTGMIYRCYYNKGTHLWVAKDERPEKFKPNNKKIVNEIVNYFKNPWNLEEIKHYITNTYYQLSLYNTSLALSVYNKSIILQQDKYIQEVVSRYFNNGTTLDIGCGYKTKKYIKTKNYIGIDIDYNVIQKMNDNNQLYLIDFNKDWNKQLELFNKDTNVFEKNKFSNLLCLNSIHNVSEDANIFSNYINRITQKNSIFIIKFLDNDVLKTLLGKDEIISKETNFVKYHCCCKIKYYYSSVHSNPIIENVYTKKDILTILENKWTIVNYKMFAFDNTISKWDNYFNCFSVLILTKH